jgi:hypothetical protein
MPFAWKYEAADGGDLPHPGSDPFSNQSDAESWLGENWRDLAARGIAQVSLVEDDRVVYGPMPLEA